MGEIFVLEHAADPIAVRRAAGSSKVVHLTDSRTKTLCGLTGTLIVEPRGKPATCRKCLQAKDGKARIRREFR